MKINSLFALESTKLLTLVVVCTVTWCWRWCSLASHIWSNREGVWVGVLSPAVAAQEWREQCSPKLTGKTLWIKLGLLKIPWCGNWWVVQKESGLWDHYSPEMEKSLGTSGSTNISGVPTSSYQVEHGPAAFLSPERSPSCGTLSFPPTLLLKELSLLSTTSPFLCFLLLLTFPVFLCS